MRTAIPFVACLAFGAGLVVGAGFTRHHDTRMSAALVVPVAATQPEPVKPPSQKATTSQLPRLAQDEDRVTGREKPARFGTLDLSSSMVTSPDGVLYALFTGPEVLVERSKGGNGKPGQCGYSIDWGDGQADPKTGCTSNLSHHYAKPGDYTAKVRVYDLDKDGKPANARSGSVNVSIAGPKA